MKRRLATTISIISGIFLWANFFAAPVIGDGGHQHGDEDQHEMLEHMRDIHRGHEHGHDFEAMDEVSPEDMRRVMAFMTDVGLALPPMDSHRGRDVFLAKGCVVCHSVNGIGGTVGPSLDARDMPAPMNAFEFAARMWRGAPAMTQMQQDILGDVINLSGQDLADLVAFAHDESVQSELTASQIPERYRDLIIR